MKREIKFKGKRIDNGEWVYGIVIFNKLGTFISTEDNPHYCNQYGYIELSMPIQVVPESVGQFTGLYDKNGKEIYEGDLIKMNTGIAEIRYSKIYASFGLIQNDWAFMHYFNEAVEPQNTEVIGNIHENPELIKNN